MRSLRKLQELSWSDRGMLLQAAVLLAGARVWLRFIDFRVDPTAAEASPPPAAELERATAIARIVGIAATHSPVTVACLPRALVLWRLLRRTGIHCEIRLSARAGSGGFAAHAWVQCAGVALNEDAANLAQYAPFAKAVVPVGPGLWSRPGIA
jgi:hypothetical protein